jgi:hypothetical protein
VPDHCSDTPLAKIFFHASARVTQLSCLKHSRTNLKPLASQSIEIHTLDHQVATQKSRVDLIATQEMRRLRNELLRNNGYLPPGAGRLAHAVITL